MFRIYKEYWEDDKIVMYPYMDISNRDEANELALNLRYDDSNLFSTSVMEVEPGTPFEVITV
jgi:hypothetical protein